MAHNKLIVSTIQQKNEEYQKVDIDLFEYLENTGSKAPVLVVSDIILPKGKRNPLPDFSGIFTDSVIFNSNDWRITNQSKLPGGISELICLYSIASLDDLIGVLPDSVNTVHVRNKILNNITKDTIESAQRFTSVYPAVSVFDERRNSLQQRIAELSNDKEPVLVEQKKDKKNTKNNTPIKTDEWISKDDFINCVRAEGQFSELNDECLERYFKMARSKKSGLNITSIDMLRSDGVQVSCVKKQDMYLIVKYIYEALTQAQKQKEKTVKSREKAVVSQDTLSQPTSNNSEQGCYFDAKKVVKTKVNKYIHKQIIDSIHNGNRAIFLKVLQTIDLLNVIPTDTKGNKVCYINDKNVLVPIPDLKLKSVKCICQAMPNNNAARIVWAIQGNDLIAFEYFAKHEDSRAEVAYKECIRKIQLNNIPDIKDCKNVKDLIEEYSNTDDQSILDNSNKKSNSSKNKKICKSNKTSDTSQWSDVTSVAYEIHEQYLDTKIAVMRLILKLEAEENTDKKIQYADSLAELLRLQKGLEEDETKLKKANKTILDIQRKLEQQKKR